MLEQNIQIQQLNAVWELELKNGTVMENRELGNLDTVVIHVGTNNLMR
jgi:hypothetical protein